MVVNRQDRSLGDLLGDLSSETSNLVRQEVALAKTELMEKATQVGRDVGFLAAGGLIAYAGLLAVLAAIIIALANVMPWWMAALVVGLTVIGIGYALVQKGLDALKHQDFAPRQTMETLKENAEWLRQQTR